MKIESGRAFYGQKAGVLVFSTETPRIPGDAGHAASFNYPVRYEVIEGGFADLIDGSEEIKSRIIKGCRNLSENGIKAVIGDCGMMSLYQDVIAKEVPEILFAGSSLCLIPLVWQLIGRSGRIGIMTGHSEMLQKKHLENSGWTSEINLSIQGMQDEPHFSEIVIHGGKNLDVERMRGDVLSAAGKLIKKTSDLRAIIFECSNLGTYAKEVQDVFGVPVFDVNSVANLIQYGINAPDYLKSCG